MQSYCVKCRIKVEAKDLESIVTEGGKHTTRGKCPICGTFVFRIGGGTGDREERKPRWTLYTRSKPTGTGWEPYIPADWLRNAVRKIQHQCEDDSRVYTAIIKGKSFIYKATFSGHGCSNVTLQSKRR